ncbi:two-component sensor histidine kinase [Campylobacter sp. MIT 99-7217]|uniref:sensor histidine kinase n=1 Tax=Campylobacter sp. MIT 99-7217 TaxID=535091 RepID=UPI00115BAEF3|nr:ATP-binding protein [Campylobacter sp. MIT 99-7217]TQR33002.1 two-component sensor histidine kinase [Campylobacter sp. MIT 99-7217]
MDKKMLQRLDSKEKEELELGLKSLIEQTYVIENEYKQLNESYASLRKTISEIIEVLPTALWVLHKDKQIFLQNHQALENEALLSKIDTTKPHYELEFEGKFYIIKNTFKDDKIIISATDISDEKRNERLASMGSVAAHLAHEIRNPIGSVSLLASTLFSRTELKNKHIVLEMQKAIARVERIVNSTLLFTKGVHINKEKFDLLELKDECEQAVNSYNFSSEIDFEFDFFSLQINADKALLSLVLQNLIFNAIDASEEAELAHAKIKIESLLDDKDSKRQICIKVFDEGVAIKDEQKVFEAFKTTKLKGNGLGLCLCKEIINAHGGEIGFEKNPKYFYFTLPL